MTPLSLLSVPSTVNLAYDEEWSNCGFPHKFSITVDVRLGLKDSVSDIPEKISMNCFIDFAFVSGRYNLPDNRYT